MKSFKFMTVVFVGSVAGLMQSSFAQDLNQLGCEFTAKTFQKGLEDHGNEIHFHNSLKAFHQNLSDELVKEMKAAVESYRARDPSAIAAVMNRNLKGKEADGITSALSDELVPDQFRDMYGHILNHSVLYCPPGSDPEHTVSDNLSSPFMCMKDPTWTWKESPRDYGAKIDVFFDYNSSQGLMLKVSSGDYDHSRTISIPYAQLNATQLNGLFHDGPTVPELSNEEIQKKVQAEMKARNCGMAEAHPEKVGTNGLLGTKNPPEPQIGLDPIYDLKVGRPKSYSGHM